MLAAARDFDWAVPVLLLKPEPEVPGYGVLSVHSGSEQSIARVGDQDFLYVQENHRPAKENISPL